MRIARIALTLLCIAATSAAADGYSPPASAYDAADFAYQSYLTRFWVGTPAAGHFAIINGNNFGPASNPVVETPPQKPWLWQYAEAWNVPYAYWKTRGSADAKTRLTAVWGWVKSNWTAADLGVCGGVGGQSASTLDDAAWVVRGLVELNEATGDPATLTYAKAMLDCMGGSGFMDGALGGGHWYDATPISSASWSAGVETLTLAHYPDVGVNPGQVFNLSGALSGTYTAAPGTNGLTIAFPLAADPGAVAGFYHSWQGKGFNSLNFALAELTYANAACAAEGGGCPNASVYFNAAKAEVDWANATLDRAANANCPQNDHLFWASVGSGTPPMPTDIWGTLCPRAQVIALAGSVVALVGDMGGAAANAMLAAQTHNPAYADLARSNAASILAKESDVCGAFLDDRDARGNGFAGYDFAANVMPLLTGDAKTGVSRAFQITANATVQRNLGADSSFGGDWCGPWNGTWTRIGYNPDQLEISAQAAVMTIAALAM